MFQHLLKSELFTKQACRDKTCSFIFSNSMLYYALCANVLSTVLQKKSTDKFLFIHLGISLLVTANLYTVKRGYF